MTRKYLLAATLLALLFLHKRPVEAAINFPSSLDDDTTLYSLSTGDVYIAQHHNNPKDAILALEAKVGIDNSAVTTSLDYLVKNTSSVDPGHKHTGTSVSFADGSAASPGLTFGNPVTDTNTGVFHPAVGVLAFSSAGTEEVRINGTGVGIGTTDPKFSLDVAGTIRLQSNNTLCFGGTGAADNDTCLYRSAADTLKTDDSLIVAVDLTVTGTTTTGGFKGTVQEVTLANGANSDVSLNAGTTVVRLVGPTAAFNITGFTGGASGRILYVYSTVSQTLTITNDATSTAANRFLTNTAADVACTASENAAFTLVYDGTSSRWRVVSVMNCPTT